MSRAFTAACDELVETEECDLGNLFYESRYADGQSCAATMGTLMATGFMRGVKTVTGKTELSSHKLADFFQAFVGSIMERGKAKPGEKTIIDSLKPPADALTEFKEEDTSTALQQGLAAAERGLESTKDMIAQHGRIAYYKERSKGFEDPGPLQG